jgi:hypothetical protein
MPRPGQQRGLRRFYTDGEVIVAVTIHITQISDRIADTIILAAARHSLNREVGE